MKPFYMREFRYLLKKTGMKEEKAFESAGEKAGGEKSQMFGKPCYKSGGKAFLSFFEKCAVFKLAGEDHRDAMALSGSKLFDPSGKGRAMKEWVQVKFLHVEKWNHFAERAAKYINNKSK